MGIRSLGLCALGVVFVGCGAPPPDGGEPVSETHEAIGAPLGAAYCDANVIGKGTKSVEDDYLPHVITCENGGADLQALKAQAIAARSVLYYNMASQGSICDGQGCQVYSCGAEPQAKHYQAVKETAGMYLSYGGMLTYGFYVAGDPNTGPPYCAGSSGTTEKFVTYNSGKSGTAVEQTSLGYIGSPGFGQNRGCMGQWGARCLETFAKADYLAILRFYYGEDIQVLKATGPCTGNCDPTGCNGSKIVSACGEGDCAAYGATCVDDSLGVRCASVFCPAVGQKKVCVNEKLIGDCNDGGITTGDCSAYGTVCIDDEKGARCVVVFCADRPTEAHDVCIPNGQLGHCSDVGGIEVEDCPAASPCASNENGAACGAPPPPSGTGGSSGSSSGGSSAGGSGGKSSSGGSSSGATGGVKNVNPPKKNTTPADDGCAVRAPRSRAELWPLALLLVLAARARRRKNQ